MKILVCIASYGTGNISFLHTILKEYNSMGNRHQITICIDSTDDIGSTAKYCDLNIIQRRYLHSVKETLVFTHREYMAQNASLYDLFIYTENDMLITESNIAEFLRLSDFLPEKYIPGFVRYEELTGSTEKYLLDHGKHGWHLPIVKSLIQIGGEDFLELCNTHQGCFLLTNTQILRVLSSPQREVFLRHPAGTAQTASLRHYSCGYGTLESGASDVFNNCGFTKVIAVQRMEQLLIRHLPDKYSADFLAKGILDEMVTLRELQEYKTLNKVGLRLRSLCLFGMARCFARWARNRFIGPPYGCKDWPVFPCTLHKELDRP